MTETDKLAQAFLPCPFCGCEKVFAAPDEFGSGGQPVPPWTVICEGCGAEMTNEDYDALKAAWNRRTHESRAQPARAPDGYAYRYPWHTGGTVIRFSNGEEINGSKPLEVIPFYYGQPPAQPASVGDGYKQIGWVHPVYLSQHMDAGALAIEVSQPRLSDAQIPVFVRAAAPQPPARDAWDAARYRFLRAQPCAGGPWGIPRIAVPTSETSGDFVNEEDADAAIDAALAQESGA